jgi:hypothetical protein
MAAMVAVVSPDLLPVSLYHNNHSNDMIDHALDSHLGDYDELRSPTKRLKAASSIDDTFFRDQQYNAAIADSKGESIDKQQPPETNDPSKRRTSLKRQTLVREIERNPFCYCQKLHFQLAIAV